MLGEPTNENTYNYIMLADARAMELMVWYKTSDQDIPNFSPYKSRLFKLPRHTVL